MKLILIGLTLSALAMAQQGAAPVTLATPSTAEQKLFYYDGSNNLTYVCTARQKQNTSTWTIGNALTSIAVSTNTATATTTTAHGLYAGALVTVAGATVDTDLNATYVVASIPTTTTFTFTTVNVGDATYTDTGMKITTTYPLTTLAQWAIQSFKGGATLTGTNWAAANTAYNLICDNKSSY